MRKWHVGLWFWVGNDSANASFLHIIAWWGPWNGDIHKCFRLGKYFTCLCPNTCYKFLIYLGLLHFIVITIAKMQQRAPLKEDWNMPLGKTVPVIPRSSSQRKIGLRIASGNMLQLHLSNVHVVLAIQLDNDAEARLQYILRLHCFNHILPQLLMCLMMCS